MNRLLTAAVVLCLTGGLYPASAWAAGKVHAVLVLDTKGPDLAEVAREDARIVRAFLEGGIGNEFLEISEVTGGLVTLDHFRTHLERLPITNEDALVCYVSCHGATDKSSRQHVLLFSGAGKQEFVRRAALREALVAKKARLTVLFSDSCSDEAAIFNPARPPVAVFSYGRLSANVKVVGKMPGFGRASAKQVSPCFQKLFLESQGLVDINGSFENTFAWFHPQQGGVFTRSLHETLRNAQDRQPAGWADFYSGLREQTQKEYRIWRTETLEKYGAMLNELAPGDRKHIEAMKLQEEQAPQVFFLAGTRLKLVTEVKGGAVTVTDLPLDSPARLAGLKIGDVIVKVNEQRVATIEDYYDVVGPEMAKELPVLNFSILRGEARGIVTVRVPSR